MPQYLWTAFCSLPDSHRGQYDEEIDVEADTPTHAKQKAEFLLAKDYEPGLKVRRVVRRVGIFLYSL